MFSVIRTLPLNTSFDLNNQTIATHSFKLKWFQTKVRPKNGERGYILDVKSRSEECCVCE